MAQATPRGLTMLNIPIPGVRCEQGDARVEGMVRARFDELLTGRQDDPISLYDLEELFPIEELWREPIIDCDIVSPVGQVKETAAVVYRVLWSFYREGRLRWVLGPRGNLTMMKFWLE